MKRQLIRLSALLLCAVLVWPSMTADTQAALSSRTFRLEQAQRMALGTSSDIRKQNNQIILKRMKYVEAVEGIRAKVKNLRSFRWSPLLSFKFPQQLDLTEEYDLNVKPLTIQTEIDTLKHGLDDLKYEITHKANQQYFEVYLLQETTAFTQSRLDDAKTQLERNKASLRTGKATQSDVDRAQKSVDTLTKDLSSQLREFESAKTKLSELVGVDVTVGYTFANPFKTAAIPREQMESLTQYTLDHDQSFYEAKAATSTAKLNVDSYESLMRSQYGSKMNIIQTYINMAKQGMDVDYGAFQIKYKEMLNALDKPWAGKIRILFFKFTKEWFKGEIDGTRYIEDEMYAVYTACMEYGNAKKDQDALEKDLRSQVRDTYESVVTGWNTYETLQSLAAESKETLDRLLVLNRMGKATYTEVADQQEAYQVAQQDALDALKEYNVTLSEFDRLTCGAVTKYLKGTGMGLDTGEGGDAYAVLDPINDPYYYIYTSVADLTFYIGVSIPDGFEPMIDSFEVWYAGTQIGERTQVGTELRHLTLDYQDTSELTIRLYYGGTFVDECTVDASVPRDVLDIQRQETETETERVIGSYMVTTTMEGGVSVSELKLIINAVENAATYTLTYGDQGIYTTDKHPVTESFTYLTLLIASLENVTVKLYDKGGEELMDVRCDTSTQELVTTVSGT
ncbi:TolC family protein [Oscillibacter sp.]|uniref:TolC family protein n=1 Tax=Oscillibacter sp. TaxID=1945593 RepID=UPI001B65529B|nr:TolC family protein [Oscillibacter sp.]MBP3508118.1 TolC family protein [Oscillibacter sp.]